MEYNYRILIESTGYNETVYEVREPNNFRLFDLAESVINGISPKSNVTVSLYERKERDGKKYWALAKRLKIKNHG